MSGHRTRASVCNDEIFRLADGSIWQVKYEYEYLYAYYPSVIICPTRGTLLVDDKSLNVVALTGGGGSTQASFESYIMSKFDGLEYGNLYQLANGQVWEQVEPWIWVWIWVRIWVCIWVCIMLPLDSRGRSPPASY